MKNFFIFSLILCIVLACTISKPESSFDAKAATQVAIALTATALNAGTEPQGTEIIPTETQDIPSTPTTTITPVPSDDPKQELGQPTWRDDLTTGKNWQLDKGEIVFGETTFSEKNGSLSARMDEVGKFNWFLNYLTFQDAYLEATFKVNACSKDDQYGLVFRSPDYETGIAYYFHVTCDGHYDLQRWINTGNATMLLGMPSSEKINTGADQTNILGVWAKGPIIRLYINNNLVSEIDDSELITSGHFGIFINARQTSGFTIEMDEISYWALN